MKKYKLGIITSHPIQYQAPMFKALAGTKNIEPHIYFCWDFGINKEKYDAEFGRKIKWDIPLLSGYNHTILKNVSLKPSSNFWGQINLGIISEVFKKRYDTLLLYGWNSFTNLLAFITAKIINTPVFFRGESSLKQELNKSKFKLLIKRIILTILFKFASGFLYIGEDNKNFYFYYGATKEKLFFTPYAVDNERFFLEADNLKPKKEELRKKEGILKNDIVILFVGKLIEKKRPFDVLLAYEKISIQKPISLNQIKLMFVGDGEQKTVLSEYVSDKKIKNVYFVGFKNQTEISRYYTIADMLVLPSGDGETWGLVVNEAMCFGLPIIVSDIVGCGPDLVGQEKNGFVIPVGDIQSLARAFLILCTDGKKREQFGAHSREIVERYGFANDIRGIVDALKSHTRNENAKN